MKRFILLVLISTTAFSSSLWAKTITLSAGMTVAPYIIAPHDRTQPPTGFEIEIIREALKNHTVRFLIQPLRRSKLTFKSRDVDGVIDIKSHYPEIKGAFVSDDHIAYLNYVVSLSSRKLKIKTISDLADKSVVGFQQAKIAFGKEFEKMASANKKYFELADQRSQVTKLFKKRVDALVLDKRIFEYIRVQLKDVNTSQKVTYHKLFEPSTFAVAFWSKETRDEFNAGLKRLKKSGRYNKIINKYLKKK